VEIRIGSMTYAIVEVENLCDKTERLDGQITHRDLTIQLEKTLCPDMKEHDERLLDVLAYGIVGVLRDNLWLGSNG